MKVTTSKSETKSASQLKCFKTAGLRIVVKINTQVVVRGTYHRDVITHINRKTQALSLLNANHYPEFYAYGVWLLRVVHDQLFNQILVNENHKQLGL